MLDGMPERPLEAFTLQELFANLLAAQQQLREAALALNIPGSDEAIWYRGSPRASYALVPSLLRFDVGLHHERELYERFLEHRAGFADAGLPLTRDWDALFEMQHHFLPTRLLDWSSSFGVALHFALHDQPRDAPTIWVLHAGILNARCQVSSVPMRHQLDELGVRYEDYLAPSPRMKELPLAVIPHAAFPRLRAQRGRFTIHGKRREGIEELCPEAVAKVRISNRSVDDIGKQLVHLGIDTVSMFPDHAGLVDFLKRRYRLTHVVEATALRNSMRHMWLSDIDVLRGNAAPAKRAVSITGIENCVTSSGYIPRDDDRSLRELESWLCAEGQSGIRVVRGQAGSGKTSALFNLIERNQLYDRATVLWLPLFRFDRRKGLLENIRALPYLESHGPGTRIALAELLSRSDTILILDGLDELSKLQGRGAVKDLCDAVREELGMRVALKIVVSCRDDIFESLREDLAAYREIVEAQVHEMSKLSIDGVGDRCSGTAPETLAMLAEFPILLEFVPVAGSGSGATSPTTFLAEAASRVGANLGVLGLIATEMLNRRRQDFLTPEQFHDFESETNLLFGRPRFLLREKNGHVRFLHHNVREFVLGWNVYHSLLASERDAQNMLARTANLDYVGSEVYRAVSELVDAQGAIDWGAVRRTWETLWPEWRNNAADRERRNSFAWGAFESAGMLGVSHEQEPCILDWIRDVLRRDADGRDDEVSFLAKYNAARCLERLHGPSSPPGPHWRRVTGRWRDHSPRSDFAWVYGYAVRGFQRQHLMVADRPPLQFLRSEGLTRRHARQREFSELLLRSIHELARFAEISDRARYLLVNMTYALIRWYDSANAEALRAVVDMPILDREARANLYLTSWCWHGPGALPSRSDLDVRVVEEDGVVKVSMR